jgi:hypothetical protein
VKLWGVLKVVSLETVCSFSTFQCCADVYALRG